MDVAGHECPLASDVVGRPQVHKFLTKYCRIASKTEVAQAGFIYEEKLPNENWYLLIRSPTKEIKIPDVAGKHLLLGKWTTGTVFLQGWILSEK